MRTSTRRRGATGAPRAGIITAESFPTSTVDQPATRFAAIGADRIAYQVGGEGPRSLVLTSGLWSHLEMLWEEPGIARVLRRLGSFGRLIRFDRRGSGLSDPRPADGGSLVDHWIADLLAVLDATGTHAPIIVSTIDSGPLVLKFVERHPERCSGLVFANTTACYAEKPGYPEGHPPAEGEAIRTRISDAWGREEGVAQTHMPAVAGDPARVRWYAKFQRAMASPRTMAENLALTARIDARDVLPTIRVPTLVIARHGLEVFPPQQSRYLARHIPGARYEEIEGRDLTIFWEHADTILALIEEFVTGERADAVAERALATLLFTDIVDSTRQLAKLGDAAWRELLDQHDRLVAATIAGHGGKLVDNAGDGTLATFGTPGRAIDCALALHAALKPLRLEIRTGLHIGEIELREHGRIGGMAVHIGARVLGRCEPGEVLVSRTVRDVMIGSRYEFDERGIHSLKGVPSKWPLYAVLLPD